MTTPTGEKIWITGASSGMGRELALRLAEAGNEVLVTARNREALESMAAMHSGITPVPADLSDPDCVVFLQESLKQHTQVLDRMILNAGTCEYLEIDDPDWQMMERVMSVNYFGAIRSLAAGLPLLKQHSTGARHIVAVGSQASRVVFPRAEAYGASKAALTYFMESLAVDLADQNIRVSVVQPGFVETPLTESNDFPMPFLMSVDQAAEHILKRLMARPTHIRFPWSLSSVLAIGSTLPWLWRNWVAPKLTR
ncbi:SDR family NAD(P)-dependent oxidoreductase [Aestuariicella sp. G3-2]|uniref:SDR family NAD(P)-dependent oxidoreductase n=1 Tax=Pseudomaricurvus albidus TaxID=2842452 RepID=UPI001C0B5089|nr:SDR family NAD(P)-dependent oxidoreductase [Aestuariicella albida]MBU3071630.1 SDR family NAD(P)-dependent oxidoreductase [Aestuariicella albida]